MEDDIRVNIVDEASDGAITPDPKPDPVAELKSQFDELKTKNEATEAAKLASDRRASDAARAADAARREATQAKTEVAESQRDTIESGISAAQSEVDAAKQAIKTAAEAGDFDKQADAYDRLSKANARLVRLDEAKVELESRKPRTEERPRDDAGRFVSSDPFEQHLSQYTKPTSDWMRAHKEWVEDPRKSKKLSAAHFDAESEGLVADTPAYFAHVETYLGLREQPSGANGANGTVKPRARAAPVAPVNGGGGTPSIGANSGNEVTLTRGEAAAAQNGTHVWGEHDFKAGRIKDRSLVGSAIGIQEFARRKQTMMKQGLYDKTYTEA